MIPRAYDIAERLSGGRRVTASNGWYPTRGICHGGDSLPGSLRIKDYPDGQGIAVKCWKHCTREAILLELERATGWSLKSGRYEPPDVKPQPTRQKQKTRSKYHLDLWSRRRRVPIDDSHPARLWAANRSLYWSQIPWPDSVQWISAARLNNRKHQGSGAIIAAFAPVQSWMNTWPKIPAPSAVELIHIDDKGQPAMDRPESEGGRAKRTYGVRTGALCMMGDPRPEFSTGLVLTEGVADALALAARDTLTAASVGGTSGMVEGDLDEYVMSFQAVKVVADSDTDGIAAARAVRRRLGRDRIRAVTIDGADDPADAASNIGLCVIEDLEPIREFASDLKREGLPGWEAARLAIQSAT